MHSNIVYSMLSKYVSDKIAQENHLCNNGPILAIFLQENNLRYVVLNYLGQHCIKQLPAQYRQFSPTGHSLVNIFQIRLRQNCTRKLLVQCWPGAHRYTFAGKPAVSNMSGDLFFNRVQHHRTILALCVQCWLRSPFTACVTALNKGPTLTGTTSLLQYYIDSISSLPMSQGLLCNIFSFFISKGRY